MESMSKPKESITVEKLKVLSTALGDFRAIIDKTVADCEAAELDAVLVEGWPTLARGFQFMVDQAKKLVGKQDNREKTHSRYDAR